MEEKKKVGAGFGVLVLKDSKILLGKRHEDPVKASSLLMISLENQKLWNLTKLPNGNGLT